MWMPCHLAVLLVGALAVLAADEVALRVDPGRRLAAGLERKLGINLTDLVDNDCDWRPGAPRSTLDALVAMRVTSLRVGADELLWSRPPFDAPRWTWARSGPEEWLPDTPQFTDDDKATVLVQGVDVDLLADWCRTLGAEATVIVPFDSMAEYQPATFGTAPSADELLAGAVALVRYCNVTRGYGFRYWELGNESELNGMPSQLYAAQGARFAAAMKAVDPTIRVGVCADTKLVPWLKPLFAEGAGPFDFVSIHEYPCWQWGGYARYRKGGHRLTGKTDTVARFLDRLPAGRGGGVEILATEVNSWDWSKKWPERNSHGHALVTAEIIGRHLVHPRCTLAQLWATRYLFNLIPGREPDLGDALAPDNAGQPSGLVMELWGRALLDEAVAVAGETTAVRAFTLRAADGSRLHLVVINKEPEPAAVRVAIAGEAPAAIAGRWTLAGTDPDGYDTTLVAGDPVAVADGALAAELPPLSVTLFALAGVPETAPAVPAAPAAPEAGPDRVALAWEAAEGAWTYEILRDGAVVGTSVRPWFADRGVTAGVAVRYAVRARNRAGVASELSPVLEMEVPPDVTPPRVMRTIDCGLADRVDLVFDEPVDPASAADPAAWEVAGATVRGARVAEGGRQVVLQVDPLGDGAELAIRAPGVRDPAGNAIGDTPALAHRHRKNLFYNPGFEEPNRQWARWDHKQGMRFDHPQAHGGERALYVPPKAGGAHNRRADRFLPGRTYRLRWFARTAGAGKAWLGVRVLDFQFGNGLLENKVELEGGDWRRYETTFVMPAGAQQVNFWVWADEGCELWVDDIELMVVD